MTSNLIAPATGLYPDEKGKLQFQRNLCFVANGPVRKVTRQSIMDMKLRLEAIHQNDLALLKAVNAGTPCSIFIGETGVAVVLGKVQDSVCFKTYKRGEPQWLL